MNFKIISQHIGFSLQRNICKTASQLTKIKQKKKKNYKFNCKTLTFHLGCFLAFFFFCSPAVMWSNWKFKITLHLSTDVHFSWVMQQLTCSFQPISSSALLRGQSWYKDGKRSDRTSAVLTCVWAGSSLKFVNFFEWMSTSVLYFGFLYLKKIYIYFIYLIFFSLNV